MGLLDGLFKGQDKKQPNLQRVWSQAPKNETTRLPNLYHQTPRLDPVELIASTIAGLQFELFDKAKHRKDAENAEPIFDHPFYELTENPSEMFPELDGYALKYLTVVLTELLGECFWVKFRTGNKVTEILPFPPAWCILTPTAGNPNFLFQPFGTTASRTITVPPSDVVWFKQMDMTDPYGRGRGRTEAVGDEIDSDEMAAKWQKNYFYNDATPPIWVNLPGAQKPDLERMRDTWTQRLGGWLNARKPAFTNADGVTITKLGDTGREMDFVESRKYMRDVFLQHYQIPPEMFGIIESSNRSTIDSAFYLYSKNVIQKRLGFYERAITRQLITPDFDARLVLKFKFEIPEDEAFKLQKVNEGLTRGALTRADWKKAMGYKVEKGDDVYLVPMSLVEVPKNAPIEKPQEEPTLDIADDEPVKAVKSVDARKAAHWKAADNRARQGEGIFRARVRAFAEVQSKRATTAIKASPKNIKSALDGAFSGADEALKHALAPAWLSSMTDGAEIGRGVLGLKIAPSFVLYTKAFDAWIKTRGLELAKDINQTTYDDLRKKMNAELEAGIEAGESIDNLADRMTAATAGVYENMTKFRAEMIARTETMRSVNFGQNVVYKEEGVEEKEWIATLDSDVRDSHARMDGKTVGINDAFEVPAFDNVESDTMDAPACGDVAGQNINCRCTIIPIIKG